MLSFYPDCLSECTYKPLKTKIFARIWQLYASFLHNKKVQVLSITSQSKFISFFFFYSHLVCTYLYFTDDWRSVSEYRIHSIQYFTLQFNFHIKHLLIFHFVYLYKKKNFLQCHRQCSFSPFYQRHHLCF